MKDSADGTIVIGSDTVVVFENVILGKPYDTEDAVNTLKKLQANTHQVYTGVSVWEKKEKNAACTPQTALKTKDGKRDRP